MLEISATPTEAGGAILKMSTTDHTFRMNENTCTHVNSNEQVDVYKFLD